MADTDRPRPTATAHHHGTGPSRRRVLELAGGAAVVSLAGCLGGGGASPDQPVEPSEDASCGVCKMTPATYPDWNAQLTFADGERVHFCSPGCFVAFYADPGHFTEGRGRGDVANAWVTDYASKTAIDAATASFVLEMDPDRIDAPMMKNPVPFAEAADAREYVDQYDDLDADDVVGLDAFDRALARQYRAKFFD